MKEVKYPEPLPHGMFVGREEEMEELELSFSARGFRMVVVYGRRRVGKTELLERFAEGKRCVFFTARNDTAENNMSALLEEIPARYVVGRTSMSQILESVALMAEDRAEGKLLFVVDEFPYLAESVPGAASALQIAVDKRLKGIDMMVVLCGSSMSSMVEGVLSSKSPLYGRRTGSMKVEPLGFPDACRMLEGFGTDDAFRIYSMVGGVPAYLELFDPGKGLDGNVSDLFLRRTGFFQNEVDFLMREEMRSPAIYTAVIAAIAKGKGRISEIADATRLETSAVSKRVSDLIELGIVRRSAPFGEASERKSRYVICDNYIRFNFAVLAGHTVRNTDESRAAALSRMRSEMDSYMGRAFEDVCRAHCIARLGCTEAGSWWGQDPARRETAEIDIVGADTASGDGVLLFAECKHTRAKAGLSELNLLKQRSMLVRCEGRRYALFSASGFDDDLAAVAGEEGVALVSMEDLRRGRSRPPAVEEARILKGLPRARQVPVGGPALRRRADVEHADGLPRVRDGEQPPRLLRVEVAYPGGPQPQAHGLHHHVHGHDGGVGPPAGLARLGVAPAGVPVVADQQHQRGAVVVHVAPVLLVRGLRREPGVLLVVAEGAELAHLGQLLPGLERQHALGLGVHGRGGPPAGLEDLQHRLPGDGLGREPPDGAALPGDVHVVHAASLPR